MLANPLIKGEPHNRLVEASRKVLKIIKDRIAGTNTQRKDNKKLKAEGQSELEKLKADNERLKQELQVVRGGSISADTTLTLPKAKGKKKAKKGTTAKPRSTGGTRKPRGGGTPPGSGTPPTTIH